MSAARTRSTAEERRTALIEVALSEFAVGGLHGTSTEVIARRAGISHAYLFRLFGTKKQLFLACVHRGYDRVGENFAAAVSGEDPAERLAAMGAGYIALLDDRELLLMQMQTYAACSDPEIRDVARERYRNLCEEVAQLSGAEGAELQAFFAMGMLLNVAASMDFAELSDPSCW